MSKTAGKVHYLRIATPPAKQASATMESLFKRLESRLDQVEKDFRKLQEETRSREKPPTGPSPAEPESPEWAASLDPSNLEKIWSSVKSLWFGRGEEKDDYDEFGMDAAFARKVKPIFDFLYYDYWRVKIQGIKNIPSEGRGLIVANHSGTLPYDGAMIRLAIENDHPSRRDTRFLVEDFVYHFPFLGTFMYRIGGVRACPENAERLLNGNHLVTVFPEGVKGIGKNFKNRYQLQRFGRGGFIKLALQTASPIIPTAVIGAEEIHPLLYKSTVLAKPLGIPYIPITPTLPLLGPLGLIPLPSKWTIVFGRPLEFHHTYGPEAAEDQLLVNRLSEQVRVKVQEMVVEVLKSRRSVWFG